MGFSSTVGSVLILTTLLICSVYLYSSVDVVSSKFTNAYSQHAESLQGKMNENLEFVEITKLGDDIVLKLSNNGTETLSCEHWTVMYNGTPKAYIANQSYVAPLDTVQISINGSTPCRISIISEYGNKYYYKL
ncbi:flagellar protein F [Methanococcus voltae]|uniref:flagellar protein F n=1 Tax=Methanococcus voltae TaxID=2188 RepID=UPI001AE6611B|nr:flagellar protein F [Methanococcus voltae]